RTALRLIHSAGKREMDPWSKPCGTRCKNRLDLPRAADCTPRTCRGRRSAKSRGPVLSQARLALPSAALAGVMPLSNNMTINEQRPRTRKFPRPLVILKKEDVFAQQTTLFWAKP